MKRRSPVTGPDGSMEEESGASNGMPLVPFLIAPLVFIAVASPGEYIGYTLVLPMLAFLGFALVTGRAVLRAADGLMLMWTALTWVSSWGWTQAPWATEIALRTQLAVCVIFIVIRLFAASRGVLLTTAVAYVAGALAVAFRVYEVVGLQLRFDLDAERNVLEGLDQNYMAYALAVGILVLYIIGTRVGPVIRLILCAAALVHLSAISAAGTRAAILSSAALVVWWVVFRFAPRNGLRIVLAAAGALVTVSLTGWADSYLASRTEANARETGDLNGRLTLWPYAREVFAEHPLFGVGAGAFRAMNPFQIVTHNAPLEIATGLGVAGLIVFFGTFYFALVVESQEWDPSLRAMYVGALIVVISPILVSGHWYQAPAMWAVIALISRIDLLVSPREHLDSTKRKVLKVRRDESRTNRSELGQRAKGRGH